MSGLELFNQLKLMSEEQLKSKKVVIDLIKSFDENIEIKGVFINTNNIVLLTEQK